MPPALPLGSLYGFPVNLGFMPWSITIIVNSATFQAKSIVPMVIFYDPATITGAPVKLSLYQIAPIKIVITTPLAIFPSR